MRSRSSRSQIFFQIGVLKNFAKVKGKNLRWSLFLIKLQPQKSWKPANFLKRDSKTSEQVCRTPLNDCFWRCHAEFDVVIYIVYPAVITLYLKEHLEIRGYWRYVDIAHIISRHLQFDLIEIYLLIKQRLKCICVWSHNLWRIFS